MILIKRKRGKPAKFSLSEVKNGPIRAVGYAKKYPHQYANYWNKRHKIQVEVVFDDRSNPYFRLVEKILDENV